LFLHGATGETIADTSIGTLYRLRRSKLRALLSQGLDIRYKKRLAYVTFAHDKTSVTAYFTDGTSVSGRFLVGADGAHSMVRCCLLGPDLGAVNRLPYATSFVISSFTKDQAIFLRSFHPLLLASAHPDGLFGFFGLHDASIADDPASWTFIFYISQHRTLTEQGEDANLTSAQRLAQLKELAKNFCDPWKSAFEWTADDTPCWYSGLMDWDPSLEAHRWDNHGGLATLVGDACHCMTFQRGQGLNHSIADAGQLRDALVEIRDGGDREKVIAAFEEKMVARSGGEVRESTANTVMVHDWEKVKLSALFTKGMHKRE
jgi:2-polyprenyl-6-methoxyphenol hydroxylase-like FAD-dependent oxidoreductase